MMHLYLANATIRSKNFTLTHRHKIFIHSCSIVFHSVCSLACGRSQPTCVECGAGEYSPADGSSTCTECEPGRFGPFPEMTTCIVCGLGNFSLASHATTCTPCSAGRFAD